MDLSKLLKKKKQDAIMLKISIEPQIEGETLEQENNKEGLAPPLEGKDSGGSEMDKNMESSVEDLDMKEMFMDDAEKRRISEMMNKKEKGLIGATSLSDKAKMEMMKTK